MAVAEFGTGRAGDVINVSGIEHCDPNCLFRRVGGKFKCEKANGSSASVVVSGGVTRLTLAEFKEAAPCVQTNSKGVPSKVGG